MSAASTQDLVIVVNTPDELFNAPAVNPFSENKLEILGTSGLAYFVTELELQVEPGVSTRSTGSAVAAGALEAGASTTFSSQE